MLTRDMFNAIYIYIYIYIYMCVCVFMCVCVLTFPKLIIEVKRDLVQ